MLKNIMFRQWMIVVVVVFIFVATAFAEVDVNKASQADIDSISGIGPVTAGKILEERKKGEFKNWDDLIDRVKGVGDVNAAKMSAAGLTVGGKAMENAPAKKSAKSKAPTVSPSGQETKEVKSAPEAKTK